MFLGESKADSTSRAEFLGASMVDGPWQCARSKHLRSSRINKWSKHARHSKSWGRTLRWLREFAGFAKAMCSANSVVYHARDMRSDSRLCCLFLTEVADQMKGISRVTAARRALSAQRLREGSSSLNSDHDISLLLDGVRRSQPKTKHQVESLDVNDVSVIAAALSQSSKWHQRQLGVLIAAGFLTIMRYGELQHVRRKGVHVVYKAGVERSLTQITCLPNAREVRGLLIHLAYRKSKQDSDAWVPLSCPTTIQRLLQHEQTLRDLNCRSHRLFPSVSRRTGNPPHECNFFGATQFRSGLRKCLREFRDMSLAESRIYGGHSLRVGGSNFMRRLGVDPDVHRSLGGWSVLKSARDYMQLTPSEQFTITRALAVKTTRDQGFDSNRQAHDALPQIQRLTL